MRRLAGPLIATLIVAGVGGILLINLNLSPVSTRSSVESASLTDRSKGMEKINETPSVPTVRPHPKGDFREYPIGEEVKKNAIRVAAVWLPPIAMDGTTMAGSDIIHLEADVKSTEGNPQGFALGEFIPYLKIAYEIKPAKGGDAIQKGELLPMIASDGLHYGASVAMPKAGDFTLSYVIQPPSAGGLGRHSDPITGVASWWEPFTATFDWEYEGPVKAGKE